MKTETFTGLVIRTKGTHIRIVTRPQGAGYLIQQGPSYILVHEDELPQLIDALEEISTINEEKGNCNG